MMGMDERRGGRSECQSADPLGFRGSKYATRYASFDSQNSPLEISEPEDGELAPPGSRVSGQTHEEEPLLRTEETAL
jgi:hypothetical protein